MEPNYATQAETYYTLISEKNVEGIKKYLHSDVILCTPLATVKGKDTVVQAVSHFMKAFTKLAIRAKFGTGNQAMIVYDTDITGIAKGFPGASLLTFQDGLIVKIELFYDGTPFNVKSNSN